MGMFSVDENPAFMKMEHIIYMIKKIINDNDYDFLNDSEKINIIQSILNGNITEVE